MLRESRQADLKRDGIRPRVPSIFNQLQTLRYGLTLAQLARGMAMDIFLKIGEGYLLVSAIASVLYVIIGVHRSGRNGPRTHRQSPLAKHRSGLIGGKGWNGAVDAPLPP